jgi:chemotaxis protein histidine kinase CheA
VEDIDIDAARAALGKPAMRAVVPPSREDPLTAVGIHRFTVDDLRRWANARRRGSRGSDKAGEFLEEPDAYIRPVALKRASTAPVKTAAKKAPAKKAARPAKRATAKKAAAPVADAGPAVGAFKNIVTLDRAQKAAEAEMKKAATQQRNAAKAREIVAAKKRLAGTNPAAEPHLKAAARDALRVFDGHAGRADAALAKAQEAHARARQATDLDAAIGHAREASAALEEARAANEAAQEAMRAVRASADAKPRTPFEPAGKRVYDDVPAGYRKATPREERDNLGNAETYSGMWIAEDPGATKPQVRIKPDGTKVGLYSPEHHLAAERMKWKRVEKLRRILPPMRTALERIAQGEGGSGTDLQRQRLKDNAFSLLLTMATGMRPSDPGTKSTVKDADGNPKTVATFGSSTLRKRHVEKINRRADGSISSVYLKFPGKSGAENRIKVTDPFLTAEIARRHGEIRGPVKIKPRGKPEVTVPERDRELSPVAKSGAMNDMLREATSRVVRGMGLDEQVAENFGSLNDEEGEGSDPMSEVTGPFSNRTLRTLFANSIAPEIFEKLVAAKGNPRTQEQFGAYMEEATAQAAARLGNQHATFKKNYLSALPFLQWMPQGNKPDGTPAWEDWWTWGKKMVEKPE